MNRTPRSLYRALSNKDDIAHQFEGAEIEFDDKATLFPVQVEKSNRPRRRVIERVSSK